MLPFLIILEVACHAMSFVLMRIDKKNAVLRHGRIPEAGLLLFTLLGPLGTFCGMIWPFGYGHHKTRKPYFWGAVLIGILAHVFGILYILKNHV